MIIMMKIAMMFLSEEDDDDHGIECHDDHDEDVMMMITSEYSVLYSYDEDRDDDQNLKNCDDGDVESNDNVGVIRII
jgi:hypothetical protein